MRRLGVAEIIGKETREVEVLTAYQCDGCGKKCSEWGDTQEMMHYRNTGGYTSIFGDMSRMSLDLCQECIKARLGDIMQFPEDV